MRCIIWNCDGFGDTTKHLSVQAMIRYHKLDFIVLLETGRANFANPFLSRLAGCLDFEWFILPPRGR